MEFNLTRADIRRLTELVEAFYVLKDAVSRIRHFLAKNKHVPVHTRLEYGTLDVTIERVEGIAPRSSKFAARAVVEATEKGLLGMMDEIAVQARALGWGGDAEPPLRTVDELTALYNRR